MLPKVKERLHQNPLLQIDDIKCRELIGNLKKSVELWFINGADDEITFGEIQSTCVEIIVHGLYYPCEMQKLHTLSINTASDSPPSTTSSTTNYDTSRTDLDLNALIKIIDDFEWVLNAVNIRSNTKSTTGLEVASTPPSTSFNCSEEAFSMATKPYNKSQEYFLNRHHLSTSMHNNKPLLLKMWLKEKLHQSTILCSFLQYLASDKELLDEHYSSEALLKQEKYVSALVIGLSALETYQYALLTQIDAILKESDEKKTQHKRSNSQPNFIVLRPNKKTKDRQWQPPPQTTTVFPCIRKIKSLPEIQSEHKEDSFYAFEAPRRRCKTIIDIKRKHTKAQKIPQVVVGVGVNKTRRSYVSSFDEHQKPSTSQNSNSNRLYSRSPMSSIHLNSTNSITSIASTSTSGCSCNSTTTTRRIQIINTDDIKIWTDQSCESSKESVASLNATPSQRIPKPTRHSSMSSMSLHKSSKSVSPLNSFFSSLFTTPPSYASWYTDHSSEEEDEEPETAVESICNDKTTYHNKTPIAPNTHVVTRSGSVGSTTVFEKFLPIYGKKLRLQNSQNLFDDISSTPTALHSKNKMAPVSTHDEDQSPTNISATIKNCQSLTQFLQMSNLSRNNTELEKENAHFRISEAIISAIEHMKWNKQEPSDDKLSKEATPVATDCLSSSTHKQYAKSDQSNDCIKGGEHVPYVEEVYSEQLSAEVVGLSLISKFDEKHLPKVSELKWLVSDDDTPQKLLPMPDLTSSANPDEHVLHSVTRGTKYWAPPRQQIIFTDHPTPNRKDLLAKQNFRCAGCGMRVSPQYVHSFRYCTYLGKYHCTGCHRNQISATPAKILQAWDFKCYPVSVFAYRLLEQMALYPLFYVPDLNPALYCRSKSLLSARSKRLQLKYVKDFIRTCRFAVREQYYFESVPDYITSDVDNWSMADFIDARSYCLHRSIDELIKKCERHILSCVLCTARGFLCEHCRIDDIIYPWDSRVERCDRCGSCFHRNCWKSMSGLCCRCQRIDKRQEYDEVHDA